VDELAGEVPTVTPLSAGSVGALSTGTAAWNWKPVSSVEV
jgi:hypothetical protein